MMSDFSILFACKFCMITLFEVSETL